MKDENCIFCKIANGEIGSATVYEDDLFRVILDIAPAEKGHALVIPKDHMKDILEVTPEVAAHALEVVSKVANAMKKALDCDGINVLQNNGEAAWQSVPHLHFHIIPRYAGKNIAVPWETLSYADGEAAEYAKKIAAKLD